MSRNAPRNRHAEETSPTTVRIPISLKRRADAGAVMQGMSLNTVIVTLLEREFPLGHGFEEELADVAMSLEAVDPTALSIENGHAVEQACEAARELLNALEIKARTLRNLED